MDVVLEYKITKDTYAAQFEYSHGGFLSKGGKQVIINFATWLLLYAIALYLSVEAEKPIYTMLFLIFLAVHSAKIIPALKFKQYTISNYVKDLKEKDIVLKLDDEGMTEQTNGIVSKVPWSSVIGYELFKDNLFIELAGGLWVIVPADTLSTGSSPLGEAVDLLQSKKIPNINKYNT